MGQLVVAHNHVTWVREQLDRVAKLDLGHPFLHSVLPPIAKMGFKSIVGARPNREVAGELGVRRRQETPTSAVKLEIGLPGARPLRPVPVPSMCGFGGA